MCELIGAMEDLEPESAEAAAEVEEAQAKPKAAPKPKKPRKKVKMQDVGELKLKKDQMKKQLKKRRSEAPTPEATPFVPATSSPKWCSEWTVE